jgi:hypothetical protein
MTGRDRCRDWERLRKPFARAGIAWGEPGLSIVEEVMRAHAGEMRLLTCLTGILRSCCRSWPGRRRF